MKADLLAIEQSGAQIDEQLVNRVFRAAHSIKGGAGFFGLTTIRELAHKTENVLDLVRSRQLVPTPECVSILLLAFDKLRELVDNVGESNHADIAEFVGALTGLATNGMPLAEKPSVTARVEIPVPNTPGRLIQVSQFDLGQARRGGKCIYLIGYDLIHDIQRRGRTPLSIFRNLESVGTILETVFDLNSAGSLDDEPSNELFLEVLYATALEPDLIGQVVDVPPERVRLIEKNGALTPLSEPAATEPPAEPQRQAVLPAPLVTAAAAAAPAVTADTTIRLNVALLDSLMTLAGELVLSRNQLNESLDRQDERGIRAGAQRISLVTSELQDVVTQTRMQPLGSLFSSFRGWSATWDARWAKKSNCGSKGKTSRSTSRSSRDSAIR